MPKNILMLFVGIGILSSCIQGPTYYASLEEFIYSEGDAKFSDATLNNNVKYGQLVLREDGACSIQETRDGREYFGGGAWRKTDYQNIVSIGLSSNSSMYYYRLYARLDKHASRYTVSDKLEKLIEK